MNPVIIDVRESDEFEAEHVECSIHVPLSEFQKRAPALLKTLDGRPLVLMCRSGKRAAMAAEQALAFGLSSRPAVFEGGILEWKRQGKPTVVTRQFHFPVMRQVQLIAGGLVVIGALLALRVNPAFVYLSGFVGLGFMVAGATGFCGMAEILTRMPWNKSQPRNS
ncbi:MAG: rhodanese-like domain-containing protein [Bdellovibrionales bacterium]|nr:rhodanese-like domain-containing protein [Bdellovibrionales bacterium]